MSNKFTYQTHYRKRCVTNNNNSIRHLPAAYYDSSHDRDHGSYVTTAHKKSLIGNVVRYPVETVSFPRALEARVQTPTVELTEHHTSLHINLQNYLRIPESHTYMKST